MRHVAVVTVASLVVGLGGCVDGPFARLNPNDTGSGITFELVASRDTLRPATPVVVVQVITDPVVSGYQPLWSVTPASALTDLGNGVFRMDVVPPSPLTTQITARFGKGSKTLFVVLAP